MRLISTQGRSCRAIAAVTAFVAIQAGVAAWAPGSAAAVTNYTVTTVVDEVSDPGTGLSLREAIELANNDEDDSVIELASDATYTLVCTPDGVEGGPDNYTGDLNHGEVFEFDEALTINGNGATIVQTCSGSRVLRDRSTGQLTLDDVTITGGTENGSGGGVKTDGPTTLQNGTHVDGNTAARDGGGIDMRLSSALTITGGSTVSNNGAGDDGGGIYVFPEVEGPNGALTVTGSTIDGNCAGAVFGDASEVVSCDGQSALGGGVFTAGTVTVVDSAITDNTATSEGGGIFQGEEIVFVQPVLVQGFRGVAPQAAQVTITNSTVSGNIAATSELNSGEGGGIRSTGTVRLIQATVVDNAAGRGSNISASTLETFGSVIGLSSGDSCWIDTLNDSGYSYSDDDSCGLAGTGSTDDGADPALGALADNGGPTRTHLPDRLTSPLVDAIPFVLCPVAVTADQRGIPRPQGNGCDIGAVEVVSQIVSADIVVANDDNGTATGADFTIEVYDAGGTLVASGPDPEPGTGNASAEFVLAAGNYTFGVSGPAGYVTAVVVTIVPAAAEIIDDASAQFTLTPGEVVSAVLTADDIAPATTTTTTTTLAPTTTQGPTTTAIGVLPATGNDQSSTLALVAAMLVLLGAGTLLVTRRR